MKRGIRTGHQVRKKATLDMFKVLERPLAWSCTGILSQQEGRASLVLFRSHRPRNPLKSNPSPEELGDVLKRFKANHNNCTPEVFSLCSTCSHHRNTTMLHCMCKAPMETEHWMFETLANLVASKFWTRTATWHFVTSFVTNVSHYAVWMLFSIPFIQNSHFSPVTVFCNAVRGTCLFEA